MFWLELRLALFLRALSLSIYQPPAPLGHAPGAESPCAVEAAALCPNASGEPQTSTCLANFIKELSPACAEKTASSLPPPGSCETDIERHCKDKEKGAETRKCLIDNRKRLSPECRDLLKRDMRERPCIDDMVILCADVRGKWRKLVCLKKNAAKLSAACRKAARRSFASPCLEDRALLCGDSRGENAVRRCIAGNFDKLSAACRKSVESGTRERPCLYFRMKFCEDVRPDRLGICLRKHIKELSPVCRERTRRRTACVEDARRFCGFVPREPLNSRCLISRMPELSEACRAKARRRHPCLEDARKLCPKTHGPRSREACLRRRMDRLRESCKASLSGSKGRGAKAPPRSP